jgi:hypothetical protein
MWVVHAGGAGGKTGALSMMNMALGEGLKCR